MNMKNYCIISGTIFAVVSLVHLIRAVSSWQFQIGPFQLQNWVSYAGFLLGGVLSVWAFRLASQIGKPHSSS